ncbi:MAG: DNA-binding response regulator [Fluviicola sp.]|nr:DNA-binding response regulator [Fluviicola sp.]MBP6272631.1 DNA-binding response regulator [Fluviicola sp.]
MKKRILIIEDEPFIAVDMQQLLIAEGYDVQINFQDVANALLIIADWQPHLVLLDIHLNEEKTGIDIGEYLQQQNRIPFIYITSYSDKLTLEKVKHTRPYGFIIKPYKAADIVSTVYLVINNYQYRKIDVLREKELPNNDIPMQLKVVTHYVMNQLDKKIEVAELAAMTRWDVDHFTRVFKQYLALTPYQFILKAKIEAAAVVIAQTEEPLRGIAIDFGFSSYSNFYNAFKKVIGDTPENIRSKGRINL